MAHASTRLLFAGQVGLLGGLLACFLLQPDIVAGPRGFSNYGAYLQTVVPYTLAFVLAGAFTALAARRVPPDTQDTVRLRRALYILAGLYVAVLLSTYPYHVAYALRVLHIVVGTALFSWQILFAGWLLIASMRGWIGYALLAALLSGSLLALLSLSGVTPLLAEAQTLTTLTFSLLLVRSSALITDRSRRK